MARQTGGSEQLKERSELKTKKPRMYRVVLHNDDYTTREFVVEVLVKIFHKPVMQATQIMLDVHQKGRGTVGTYTYDVAQTKVATVHKLARENEFPLKCTIEEA